MNRRDLFRAAGAAYVASTVAGIKGAAAMANGTHAGAAGTAYRYRIGFGAWINDMRNEALPLEQWPAPQFDDITVESALMAADALAESGYEYLDAFGLWATNDYPPDIVGAFADEERNRRVRRVLQGAEKRGIHWVLPLGLFTWGYDRIIQEDPEVRGKDNEGNPHPHAMCGAKEKAWSYVEKLIDTLFAQHDFQAVHLESADLGYCMCDQCSGKYGAVGYNSRLNLRAADYIKAAHPECVVYVCPINWVPFGLNADGVQPKVAPEDMPHIEELSKHIDILMDQGHRGRFLAWESVPRLSCTYGTSGGLWAYHGCRMDRLSYCIPYPIRAARYIADHHAHGTRAGLIYQGPMLNPAVEINSAVIGRMMCDVTRDPVAVLNEVIEVCYEPRSRATAEELGRIIVAVEDAYFGQWDEALFKKQHGLEMPGEFCLGPLFNTSPDPAAYLMEPFLTADGRLALKEGLKAALRDLAAIQDEFHDHGRMARLKRSIGVMCQLLTSIMLAKGEAWAN